ncbi:CynX/NimT family MFS transporter [Asticcacaulis sp. AND118]|uniref:MFS transporter n=1 Tax=Asticcacaulis sp. AND118 TaxID=2840468 RepID=UPI001CFFE4AE|nr:MFS transporter [Asticcacaulis sp. AND118]UDF04365.1 MFS transporter [Asticcacaulis sp. AND118]
MIRIDSHWRPIFLLWFTGVLAAAALGKFASLSPVISDDLGLSRVEAGWLVSLIETGGASLGIIAGLLIARLGSRKALLYGMGLLTVGGLGGALIPGVWTLFAARLIESGGYLLVVIAAPSLIATVARPQDQGAALTLWSTFVPAGFAIGMGLSGVMLLFTGWRSVLIVWALLAGLALFAAARTPAVEPPTKAQSDSQGRASESEHRFALFGMRLPPLPVWLMCAGFGFYTTLFVGLIAMFPLFLTEQGQSPSLAATVTGIASAATLGGAWAAAQALQRGERARWIALFAGLLIPAGLACLIFIGGHPLWLAVLIVALNAVSGIGSSLVFARLPHMSPGLNVAAANGVLTQFGAGGSLIGPPLLAAIAGAWGWAALGPAVVIGSVAALGLMIAAERAAKKEV